MSRVKKALLNTEVIVVTASNDINMHWGHRDIAMDVPTKLVNVLIHVMN